MLRDRIADAADQVCGGRPGTAEHRAAEQFKLLVPAYEHCRADAIRHALSSISATTGVRLADSGAGPEPLLPHGKVRPRASAAS